MRRILRSPAWLAALLIGGAALPFIIQSVRPGALPVELGPVRLQRTIVGEEARALVDHLHGMAVAEHWSAVGFYRGSAGAATLYVTVYAQALPAEQAFTSMDSLIAAGNPVFGHVRRVAMNGQRATVCSGMGQTHFFFVRGRAVYWLAADHHLAPVAARALLSAIH